MKRQATHDRSKLSSPEWEMFAEVTHKLEGLTYGSSEYEEQRKLMLNYALGHHYEHNRHHPEFFDFCPENDEVENLLDEDLPDSALKILGELSQQYQAQVNNMNLFDVLEMLIDWKCACKRHGDGDIHKSIEINTERFNLSPQLVNILKNTVPYLDDKFDDLKTQKDI